MLAAFAGSTRATCVFLSNFGVAYSCRFIDVPASTGYGEPIQKQFKLRDGERIVAALSLDARVAGDITPRKEGAEAPVHAIAVSSDGYALRFGLKGFVEPSTRSGRRYARPAEGAEIVGGHTTMGAELTLGFTVTGLAVNDPVTLAGARPGDWLVLTKPIGTGVILAAEMQRAAPGEVVARCLASMARPQGAAARILAPHAHAMTDVTGFGLAGHLMEMMAASGTAARIDLTFVPLLPGAEELSAAGHGSTLLPANRSVAARMFWTESPRADLLFDPQTAGGLLAAVPASHARDIVAKLRDGGDAATIIGAVEEGEPFLTVEN